MVSKNNSVAIWKWTCQKWIFYCKIMMRIMSGAYRTSCITSVLCSQFSDWVDNENIWPRKMSALRHLVVVACSNSQTIKSFLSIFFCIQWWKWSIKDWQITQWCVRKESINQMTKFWYHSIVPFRSYWLEGRFGPLWIWMLWIFNVLSFIFFFYFSVLWKFQPNKKYPQHWPHLVIHLTLYISCISFRNFYLSSRKMDSHFCWRTIDFDIVL